MSPRRSRAKPDDDDNRDWNSLDVTSESTSGEALAVIRAANTQVEIDCRRCGETAVFNVGEKGYCGCSEWQLRVEALHRRL